MWCGRKKKTWNFPWQWFLIQFHLLLKVPIITSAPAVSWTSSSSYIFLCLFLGKLFRFSFVCFPFFPNAKSSSSSSSRIVAAAVVPGESGSAEIPADGSYIIITPNSWMYGVPFFHIYFNQKRKEKSSSSSSFRFYSRTSSAGSLTCCSQWYATHTRSVYKYSSTHTHTHGARLSFPTFFLFPWLLLFCLFIWFPCRHFLSLFSPHCYLYPFDPLGLFPVDVLFYFFTSDTASKFRLELFGRWRFYIDCNRRNRFI